jgi:hypothetical protein
VMGIGSLPLLPRDIDPTLAPETELKLSLSMSLPFVPLPSGANDSYVFLISGGVISIVGGPMRALVGMVKVERGPNQLLPWYLPDWHRGCPSDVVVHRVGLVLS